MARRRDKGEGSVYELADGAGWRGYLDLGWEGGKRQRKYFSGKTKREVLDKLNAARHQHERGTLPTGPEQTVAQFLASWLQSVKAAVRPRTHESYQLNVNRLLPHLGRVKLSALKPQHIAHAYTALLERPGMKGKPLDPRSVEQAHTVLHTALEQAVRWDLLVVNPAGKVDAPRPGKREKIALSPEQATALFEASDEAGDRLAALWVLFATTGLRLGEATALRWEDIDLERGRLVVRRALQRQKGVGLVFVEPKSASSRRAVKLPRVAVEALREHRVRQLEERVAAGPDVWQDHGLVFSTPRGRPMEPSYPNKVLDRMLKRAALDHISPHNLRHTAASILAARGLHPKQVQELLGHSSISLTLGTYSHLFATMHDQAAEEMDALFGDAGAPRGTIGGAIRGHRLQDRLQSGARAATERRAKRP